MMTKAEEEFRKKADDAEAKAETAPDGAMKHAYLEIARLWRELADTHDASENE
jgi:hypothetical protein